MVRGFARIRQSVRGLEIDGHLQFCDLLYGQVGGLVTLEHRAGGTA